MKMAYLDTCQISLLTGLRRAGKTTLLPQLVEALLLRDVPPYRILYYSFDEALEFRRSTENLSNGLVKQ